MDYFLSKSDFKVASECPTKLWYKKNRYPSTKDTNEYLQLLAKGGHIIGKMSTMLYPEGRAIDEEAPATNDAIALTNQILDAPGAFVLFEPAIHVNHKLIRIDILKRDDEGVYHLIEVKSKSVNTVEYAQKKAENKKYFESSDFIAYIEDVTYQRMVLNEFLEKRGKTATVKSYLMAPDKSKVSEVEEMIEWFSIVERPSLDNRPGRFKTFDVEFTGDVDVLRSKHILALINVDEYADRLEPAVKERTTDFLDSLRNKVKVAPEIGGKCKKCEFKSDEPDQSGFHQCWGAMANHKPHILELNRVGQVLNRGHLESYLTQGKAGLSDVDPELVRGKYNNRAFLQLTNDEEWFDPKLRGIVSGKDEQFKVRYPLHFIDFETSQWVIPYHMGMSPYDNVIFQWSCHTVAAPGAAPLHTEWINTVDRYPNFEFAETLRAAIGSEGTVMTWSHYEATQMKSILASLRKSARTKDGLEEWIEFILGLNEPNGGPIVDMLKITESTYFHPRMGGRTSIKVVLPAVLIENRSAENRRLLEAEGLLKFDTEGNLVDPYKLLDPICIGHGTTAIADGAAAMEAYKDMLYGLNKNSQEVRQSYERGLRRYCKLDTLAMVMIWNHWMEITQS